MTPRKSTETTWTTLAHVCAESISGQTVEFVGGHSYSSKVILMSHANVIEAGLENATRELAFKLDRYTRQQVSANATVKPATAGFGAALTDRVVASYAWTNTLVGKNIARLAPYMDASLVPRWVRT